MALLHPALPVPWIVMMMIGDGDNGETVLVTKVTELGE